MEDYILLSGNSASELENKVIKYLKKGYLIAGGHQVTTIGYADYTNAANAIREIRPNKWELTQAVYRLPEEKKEPELIKQKVMI